MFDFKFSHFIDKKYEEVKEGFDESKKEIYDMYRENVLYKRNMNLIIEETEQVILNGWYFPVYF